MADLRARIDVKEILDTLRHFEPRLLEQAAKAGVESGLLWMVRDVSQNRMRGQYLGIQTGQGWKSIRYQIAASGGTIRGEFGSRLRYIRAHELGYRGPVSVPAHTVAAHTVREHARSGGQTVRSHTRREHTRRAHTRNVNIRARHFMRDTLREGLPVMRAAIERSLERLARTGQVASPGSLGG